MKATAILKQQLDTVNLRLHHSTDGLTAGEMTARPFDGVNPLGFIAWHMPRSQDWAVNTAIRDVAEVAMRDPWRTTTVAWPGIGTGFTLEEAAEIARRVELAELLAYADAVHHDMIEWLDAIDDSFLDEIPDVSAHDGRHPEYQAPGFRAEMDSGPEHDDAVSRKGGLPVWVFLASVAITHLHRHLGEIDLMRDAIRRGMS